MNAFKVFDHQYYTLKTDNLVPIPEEKRAIEPGFISSEELIQVMKNYGEEMT